MLHQDNPFSQFALACVLAARGDSEEAAPLFRSACRARKDLEQLLVRKLPQWKPVVDQEP